MRRSATQTEWSGVVGILVESYPWKQPIFGLAFRSLKSLRYSAHMSQFCSDIASSIVKPYSSQCPKRSSPDPHPHNTKSSQNSYFFLILYLLPTRTQRPIKPTHTIHILSILRLLLLPHPIHIVPLNLRILRRLEPREAHRPPHFGYIGVGVIEVHLFGCC